MRSGGPRSGNREQAAECAAHERAAGGTRIEDPLCDLGRQGVQARDSPERSAPVGAGHATKTAALVAGRQRVWDSERKRGTDSGSGFSPNSATTAFDNFLTNGQT